MDDKELLFMPAHLQREMIINREISCRELTEAAFRRIHLLDDRLHAFVTLDEERALETADSLDEAIADDRDSFGLLHGVPISVKDLEATAGLRTTFGSYFFRDNVPDQDSVVVRRLKAAGAVILGKTNTPEFGNREETFTNIAPTCNNPWDLSRTSGGSSGGAGASVASGMCALATGSDGGGSIRLPSAFCGLFGIKPTHGKVPRAGGVGRPAFNPMATSGPMSNDVRDSALMLQAICGFDGRDPGSLRIPPDDFLSDLEDDISGLRAAYSFDLGFANPDDHIKSAVEETVKTFEGLGVDVRHSGIRVESPRQPWWQIWTANQEAMYGGFYDQAPGNLAVYTREMVEHGRTVTGADYSKALRSIELMRMQFDELFQSFDMLILPTTAAVAWPHKRPPEVIGGVKSQAALAGIAYDAIPYTMIFNATHHPAVSLPCGFDSHNMPIGVQVVSRIGEDVLLMRACRAFERARPWIDMHPPVS